MESLGWWKKGELRSNKGCSIGLQAKKLNFLKKKTSDVKLLDTMPGCWYVVVRLYSDFLAHCYAVVIVFWPGYLLLKVKIEYT